MANDEIETKDVSYPGKTVELKAYVAQPSGSGAHPAVIVIQEWWGLNDNIRDIARRFARESYVAIAPNLYSREGYKVTADPNIAAMLMGGLDKPDGVADLLSTVAYLRTQPQTRTAKIGAIGFCMGGSYTMLLACASKDISAAAPFYGEIPSDDQLAHLSCPIFYAYGENDGWIKRADVDRLATTLKKPGKSGEVKIYSKCSHGFFNDTRKDVYAPAEAKDAWEHALRLFARNLKS